MDLSLIHQVLEQTDDRLVAVHEVRPDQEFLGDHFPDFPVLPGVMMLECLVQACRRLLPQAAGAGWVLEEVRNLRYGAVVRPGSKLTVEVTRQKVLTREDGREAHQFAGAVRLGEETAAQGRLTMIASRA